MDYVFRPKSNRIFPFWEIVSLLCAHVTCDRQRNAFLENKFYNRCCRSLCCNSNLFPAPHILAMGERLECSDMWIIFFLSKWYRRNGIRKIDRKKRSLYDEEVLMCTTYKSHIIIYYIYHICLRPRYANALDMPPFAICKPIFIIFVTSSIFYFVVLYFVFVCRALSLFPLPTMNGILYSQFTKGGR